MTKEEFIDNYERGYYNEYELINAIFDDFESRTCENCSWYVIGTCINSYMGKYIYKKDTPSDFGCNMFERNKDGDV